MDYFNGARSRSQLIDALDHYAISGDGDIKNLKDRDGFRLRVGSYRVIFAEDTMTILAVYIGRRATTTFKKS
jgi:mRNA interferase RelE/StbE